MNAAGTPPMQPPVNPFRLVVQRARERAALWIGLTATLALAGGFGLLSEQAAKEDRARKSAAALAFESAPADWLAHETSASDFRAALDGGQLSAVGVAAASPGLVLYTLKNGGKASSQVPGCNATGCAGTALERLGDKSAASGFALVRVDIDPRTAARRTLDAVHNLLAPLLLLLLLGTALFYGVKIKSKLSGAASMLATRPTTRFTDAIGNDEAKAALNRVKAFMQAPAHYARLGAAAPRGVLLVGPPGTGKTLLAKALAGECQANFIAVDGSYFTAMYYGAGVAKVRELFRLARRHAPCVLFIDEIDGIGRRSQGGSSGGAEAELNRIINRVLVEMDGFEAQDNVVVVAATNHEDNIDEALRRPGRFDMVVRLSLPSLLQRQQLFERCIGKLAHDGSADTSLLARLSPGLSPADIANIVNKAAASAAEAGAEHVTADHLMRAIETQQLGGEVSAVKNLLTPHTRRRLAYHEAGHALIGHLLQAGRVERVTIEPRGPALGVTYMTRTTEDPLYRQAEMTSRLAMMLAGRETELLVFDSVSSGASDDLKRASELAIQMVGSLGFSNAFGLLSVAGVPSALLGPDIQAAVLKEARALLEEGQATCKALLAAHRGQLAALAERLLECEVLAGEELDRLLGSQLALAA